MNNNLIMAIRFRIIHDLKVRASRAYMQASVNLRCKVFCFIRK